MSEQKADSLTCWEGPDEVDRMGCISCCKVNMAPSSRHVFWCHQHMTRQNCRCWLCRRFLVEGVDTRSSLLTHGFDHKIFCSSSTVYMLRDSGICLNDETLQQKQCWCQCVEEWTVSCYCLSLVPKHLLKILSIEWTPSELQMYFRSIDL